jgi:hypothetical protein
MAVSRLSQQSIQQAFPKGNTVWDGTTATSSFEPLGAVLAPSAGLSSITFSSIPSTYTRLQLRGRLRTNDTGSFNNQQMRFNSDTGSYYTSHWMQGDGSSTTAGLVAIGATNFNDFMRAASNSLTAGIFTSIVIDILDYSNTNKNTTFRALQGIDANGSGIVGITSGVYLLNDAVHTITINPSGGTAIAGSSFALYGVK